MLGLLAIVVISSGCVQQNTAEESEMVWAVHGFNNINITNLSYEDHKLSASFQPPERRVTNQYHVIDSNDSTINIGKNLIRESVKVKISGKKIDSSKYNIDYNSNTIKFTNIDYSEYEVSKTTTKHEKIDGEWEITTVEKTLPGARTHLSYNYTPTITLTQTRINGTQYDQCGLEDLKLECKSLPKSFFVSVDFKSQGFTDTGKINRINKSKNYININKGKALNGK